MVAIFRPSANLVAALTLISIAALAPEALAGGGSGRGPITRVTSPGLSSSQSRSAMPIMVAERKIF